MKPFFTIVLFLVSHSLFAQPGYIKVFDSGGQNEISKYRDLLVDNDTIILYSSSFDVNDVQGIRFAKLDTLGNLLLEKIYVDTQKTLTTIWYRKKIIKTSDGGYIIAGSAQQTPYLLKVHHDLSLDFLKFYPSNFSSGNSSLIEVEDGYMMAGGQVDSSGQNDIFVIKTDKLGNQVWRKTYGVLNLRDGAINLNKLGDTTIVITGGRSDYVPGEQSTWTVGLIIAIDTSGNEKWEWESEQSLDQGAIWDFERLPDSSWICISGTWEWGLYGEYETRPMVLRMDKDFNVMWQWIYWRLAPIQFFTDLERTDDGNFIASGWVAAIGGRKGIHYKFTPSGDSLWMRLDSIYPDSISGFQGMQVTGTALLSSGSIISVGHAQRSGVNYGTYGFVMKMSPDGCIDTLNCHPVADYEPFVQADELLVYPNPVQDYVTFAGAIKGDVVITDLLGREVKRLRMNGLSPLEWSVGDVARGLYVWRLVDDGVVLDVGKVLVE